MEAHLTETLRIIKNGIVKRFTETMEGSCQKCGSVFEVDIDVRIDCNLNYYYEAPSAVKMLNVQKNGDITCMCPICSYPHVKLKTK